MSKKDFEEYWVRRDEATKRLVDNMRLARVTGNVEGALEKVTETAIGMEKQLKQIDYKAWRCITYTTEILQKEGLLQVKGKELTIEDFKTDKGFTEAVGARLLIDHGKEFSLRLYDLLTEFGI